MVNAQQWLSQNYSNKSEVKEIKKSYEEAALESQITGQLVIADFPNLTEIDIKSQHELSELQIINCPQLTTVKNEQNDSLEKLTITNCPGVKEVRINNCHSLNNFDSSKLLKLEVLDLERNGVNFDLSNNYQLREFRFSGDILRSKSYRLSISHLTKLEKLVANSLDLTSLDTRTFPNLVELRCGTNKLRELDLSKNKKLIHLYCPWNNLTNLDLSQCSNLTELCCWNNNLTSLNLSNNTSLDDIDISSNDITSCDFLANLPHPEKVINLRVSNNNFQTANLEVFRKFINLEELTVGNTSHIEETRIKRSIYNRFYGSLEPLKNMYRLKNLSIDNTNIDSGLEYLPDSIQYFYHSPKSIAGSRVTAIHEQLRPFRFNFKHWKADYARKNGSESETRLKVPNFTSIGEKKWIYNPQSEEGVTNLDFSQRNIVGEIIFENVPKVKFLTVGNNQLTSLKISNCPNLHTIVASHNQLTCLQVENCEKVKRVFASWNCLKELNLDHLSLEVLTYDNDKTEELNAKMEVPSK